MEIFITLFGDSALTDTAKFIGIRHLVERQFVESDARQAGESSNVRQPRQEPIDALLDFCIVLQSEQSARVYSSFVK